MKRIDKVRELVQDIGLREGRGVEAQEVAALLGAGRQNVSGDLNTLWREGRLVKVASKPVLFWDRAAYERHVGPVPPSLVAGPVPGEPAGAPPASEQHPPAEPAADPFRNLIGAKESLRAQVEQAKAAILYPPRGLHTLLSGPTGVGKSLFAELMYRFGISSGALPADSPLVTLNCADYANNPQLLMAILFGATRGSYTGAERDREGLVEQADGGLLFLDEVHRLPVEGQEMLFRLIDKGLYRRLGETGEERRAEVMLIAATTERVDSALLRTFTRRIPMTITLPSLAERTVAERFRFIRRFLKQEAVKIHADIRLTPPALRALLSYECLGNVGQLHSDVKLACARAFLHYLTHRREPVEVGLDHLPEHVQRMVPGMRSRNAEIEELVRQSGPGLGFGKVDRAAAQEEEEGPITFYDLLEQQMRVRQEEGMSPDAAERLVVSDIEGHFHDFVERVRRQYGLHRQELTKLVGARVLRAAEKAVVWAEGQLRRTIPERTLYALALHLNAALERLRQGQAVSYARLFPPVNPSDPESQVADQMVSLLSEELGVELPRSEVVVVSLLLRPEQEQPQTERVGVAVLAHGRGVAQGMVDVAHSLTGTQLAVAMDMALDEDPAEVLEALVALAESGQFDGGLLLLADMGSLEGMGKDVATRAGIPVRTIGMVSPPLVAEAVHQASMPGCTLEMVYEAVLDARSRALAREERTGQTGQTPGVILTACFTGEGSAVTLAKVVQEALGERQQRVEVIPVRIGDGDRWERLVRTYTKEHRLLAVVGPVNPAVTGVPYISTRDVVVGNGVQRLLRLVEGSSTGARPAGATDPAGADAERLLIASLSRYLIFTNPAFSVPTASAALARYEATAGGQLPEDLRTGLLMHLACLVEQKVLVRLKEGEAAGDADGAQGPIRALLDPLEEQFLIRFTEREIRRLQEVLAHSVSVSPR